MADFFWTPTELAFAVPGGVVLGALIAVFGVWRSNKAASKNNSNTIKSAERQQKETLASAERQQSALLTANSQSQEGQHRADRQAALDERLWMQRSELYAEMLKTHSFIRDHKTFAFLADPNPSTTSMLVLTQSLQPVVERLAELNLTVVLVASQPTSAHSDKYMVSLAQALRQMGEYLTSKKTTEQLHAIRDTLVEARGHSQQALIAMSFDLRSIDAARNSTAIMEQAAAVVEARNAAQQQASPNDPSPNRKPQDRAP